MPTIAFVGLHHWHAPFYMQALRELGCPVAALADPDPDMCAFRARAGDCDAPCYTDAERMLREVRPDFVFAHAPHDRMTELAAWLVERNVPFHMEKPMGIEARALAAVAQRAQRQGLWNAVALVSRHYGIVTHLHGLGEGLGTVQRYHYALLAGPPHRYRDWRCEWMLDPRRAGAGPLWNFGPHVIDLFLYLGGAPVTRVMARWGHGMHRLPVEDFCTVLMINAAGAAGIGEVSYTTPVGYERSFSLSTDRLQVHTPSPGKGTITYLDGRREEIDGTEFDDVYRVHTRHTLECFAHGKRAIADMADMVATLSVMEAARESARRGGVPVTPEACTID